MATLSNKITGNVFTVRDTPVFQNGMWLCGDQNFMDSDGTDYEIVDPTPIITLTREQLKAKRDEAVKAIKVTISTGKTFDGDETSQTRMARAIIGLQAAGVQTISWTLSDNVTSVVTIAELTEALILSGQQQALLWPIT